VKTIADRIIAFNRSLSFKGTLPPNIRIMNPFKEDKQAVKVSETFYEKYYSDNNPRRLILGINPGRFGAGATGVPFTDPKRLIEKLEIEYHGKLLHEPSSVFVYEMIDAFGGAEAFYANFYINSVCPLGFTIIDKNGKEKNYNYYDSKELLTAVREFAVWNIQKQIAISGTGDVCYCMGTGTNLKILQKINQEYRFFNTIISLEHPRFIVQYKQKQKEHYIRQYVMKLNEHRFV
jgi:hypothetical protein